MLKKGNSFKKNKNKKNLMSKKLRITKTTKF